MSTRRGLKRNNSTVSTQNVESKTPKKVKRNTKRGDANVDVSLSGNSFLVAINLPTFPSNNQAGVVLVTGAGDVGQLGLGNEVLEKTRPALVNLTDEIVDVCAGGMHTVCLTKDGKVITFGCNDEGALGRNTSDKEDAEFSPDEVVLPDKVLQISAGDSHTAVLLENGRVFAWGTFRDSHGNMGMTQNGNERLPYEMLPFEQIIKISSGADHLVMLTNQGVIYTCGCAEQGQLGRIAERNSDRSARGGINKFLTPAIISTKLSLKLHFENVWAGTYCTFAKVNGKNDIYVFGLNNYNQIGIKSQSTQFSPKISKDLSKRKWKQICGAPHHTILLDEDGKVFAIGRKEYGRLGLGKDCEDAAEIIEIPGLKDKNCTYIGCGSATSFAVTDKGDLFGWGMGTSGQLGTGAEDDCLEPTVIKSKQLQERLALKVSSGGQHTVILAMTALNNNKLKSSK